MTFSPGSLVRARGREWVVLPESTEKLLILRPLAGSDIEIAGILAGLEEVVPAHFDLPTTDDLGDFCSASLLRSAVVLSSRSAAGPFRCFGRIAVEPRPYQLVPLLMALRQDPVRILIADDIGVGKTIEGCLIAREMLDRGEITRFTVLCPAQLAEQWQRELKDKFHIEAELVLPGTARSLERNVPQNRSLFEHYPFTIVSLDYIKADRRRHDFLRACPELVIVDEAHSCSSAFEGSRRHQRMQLVRELADCPTRHMVFLTATPHSGKEEAFRQLLGFLDKSFLDMPDDLTGPGNDAVRQRVSEFFVQRSRGDVKKYLGEETDFPFREEKEDAYQLHPDYRKLFDSALEYARDIARDEQGETYRKRVRWWSALALLRALASSPAAAESTLKVRAGTIGADSEVDDFGRRMVMDADFESTEEIIDTIPGSDCSELSDDQEKEKRRLNALAREASELRGKKDLKLQKAAFTVRELLSQGFRPILFCRFIPTADYVAEELRKLLPNDVTVQSITGQLPPADREERVAQLGQAEKPVLVCTDCLSEGINLQSWFNAVIHYDLSWNPTRHEQRAGRVDRFGQRDDRVRILTYYGSDNQIDGIVLDVIIRKHNAIRKQWGISVPVPARTSQVIDAVIEGLLLRGGGEQLLLGLESYMIPELEEYDSDWHAASEREKVSRSRFAQHSMKPEDVSRELGEARNAAGSPEMVKNFVLDSLKAHKASILGGDPVRVILSDIPSALKDTIGIHDREVKLSFDPTHLPKGSVYVSRSAPLTEGLASFVMDAAMDPKTEGVATRAGVTRTRAVTTRTTLVIVRFRFQVTTITPDGEKPLIAEECRIMAYRGEAPVWLSDEETEALLASLPDRNVPHDQASHFLGRALGEFRVIHAHLEEESKRRAGILKDSHHRVRKVAGIRNVRYEVEPKEPDVMGIYIYLPVAGVE